MGGHARLAPSSAHIWAYCGASVRMQEQYPENDDGDEAREGVAAHWYVSETLYGRQPVVGAHAPNGETITQEMVDCGGLFVADVRDTLAACGPGVQWYVEQPVKMPVVHPENWGTPDVLIVDHANKRLHVFDYKYGHRFVDAGENLQLIDYAIGGLSDHVPAADWPAWSVSVTIGQPRNYDRYGPLREWRVTGAALLDKWVPFLADAARRATAPDSPFQTGEYCRDCTARHACPALQAAGALAIDVSLQGTPVDLPPHAVGLELRQIGDAIKRLEARKTGLEEHALGLIRSGTSVPFFTAQHSVGRERWTLPVEQVFALGDTLGADLRKKPEAITPNQARAAFTKAGVDDAVITAYAEQPRGALRLERAEDNAASLAFE
jgi:hypothetical protein